ncbi:hypothetical protein ACFE04_013575 [Oxalis oulophora]
MAKSCKGLAMELVKCLSESDCVKKENRSYRECAGEKAPSISSECVGLRETYFNCKRGQVDMRARIRGNKGSLIQVVVDHGQLGILAKEARKIEVKKTALDMSFTATHMVIFTKHC